MDSYWMSTVNVPESANASGAEVCNSCSGVTPCIVMKNDGVLYHQVLSFSPEHWTKVVLQEHAAVGRGLSSVLEVQHGAVPPHQCHTPQWSPPSSGDQDKTTTLGTELHHSSWQCKEWHRCCHGPLELLVMGDSGTATVLTRYESMRLRSLLQIERTTARDPVQHKRWTYLCYRAANTVHQQRGCAHGVRRLPNIWQKVINKGGRLHPRYINVVRLWIKPYQKYRAAAIILLSNPCIYERNENAFSCYVYIYCLRCIILS